MKNSRIKEVAVALRLAYASHRDILTGISRYAKAHHWQLHFVSVPTDSLSHEKISIHLHKQIDGFITCEYLDSITPQLPSDSDFPIVLVCTQSIISGTLSRSIGMVNIDANALGVFGADYLRSLGQFRSFGFVPENHRNPSTQAHGFASRFERKSSKCIIYPPQSSLDGSEEDLQSLTEWLSDLPKPAAIMAAYDLRATHVLSAAHRAKIPVPEQLAVLGNDNDELLCDFSTPTLTSIAPDYIRIGELAAAALDRLMRKPGHHQVLTSTLKASKVIVRESTSPRTPAVALVERAMDYIQHNATTGITVRDVVTHLGVSRRLADQRFCEVAKTTILETILNERFTALKRRLRSSRLPIGELTKLCGFRSENHAKTLFKSRFGISMRDYRASRERS